MRDRSIACSRVLALVLPVILELSCVVRDWSLCSPDDQCQKGFTCTADWKCVRDVDGGADSFLPVDSHGVADVYGAGVDGSVSVSTDASANTAAGPDGSEPDRVPVSASPDALLGDVFDAPPVVGLPDAPAIEAASGGAPVDTSALATGGTTADTALATADAAPDLGIDRSPPVDAPGAGLGTSCTTGENCASGVCVDNVCCNSACAGQCQTCGQAGSIGTCTPVRGAPPIGKPACGGSGICAGTCDGLAATCSFPGAQTNCGAASCSAGVAIPARSCDGAGSCTSAQTSPCGNFACGPTACLTTCSDASQCAAGAICSSPSCLRCSTGQTVCSNQCVDLQTDSAHCGSCTGVCSPTQRCKGGICLLADGQSCSTDAQCAAAKCAFFYVDNDNDGYPNSQTRSGWCGVTASLLPGFIPPRSDNKWDCCDSAALVHPDQAQYFTVSAGACGIDLDYDCSGLVEKELMPGSEPCAFDANQICGSATGPAPEDCGKMHFVQNCQAITTVSPPLCVSSNSTPSGNVGCH